jgi:hypothetical protein
MDINELETWLKTPEGTKWGDTFKAPLLNKRDELLAALKEANGSLSALEQRAADAEKSLSEEREALSDLVINKELSRMLREAHVMESALPSVVAGLKDSYGITVRANGPERQATGKTKAEDGTEKEASLAEIISVWAATPAAKQITLNNATGGGASGSAGRAHTAPSLDKLSGPALAKLSDEQFHAMRQSALSARGE